MKVGFCSLRLKYSLRKKENSKVNLITIGLGFIFISILGINTIRKTHICDHEPPIPNNQLIQLNDDIIGRLVDSLRFKTVSTEGEIDYKPYKEFWDFIFEFRRRFQVLDLENRFQNQDFDFRTKI